MPRRKIAGDAALLKNAQNQLRGSSNLRIALSKARAMVPAPEMDAFVAWLPTQRRNGTALTVVNRPVRVDELWRSSTPSAVTPIREIAWASALIRREAATLTDFRRAAEDYELAFVGGRFDDAKSLLDQIERRTGASLWSIETRLALIQRMEGLEAQKAYAADIIGRRGHHDVVAFLSHHLSRRNEPSSTPLRYEQQIDDLVSSWEEAADLATYVLHRLANRLPRNAQSFADILRLEASASVVDLYETFVTLAAWSGAAPAAAPAALRDAFAHEIDKISSDVEDDRLARVAFLMTGSAASLDSLEVLGLGNEDALALDEYESAAMEAEREISADPADALAWIASARARSARLTSAAACDDLASVTIDRCAKLVQRTDDMDEALIGLLKDTLNHRLHRFAPIVTAFLWSEMAASPGAAFELEAISFVYGRGVRPSDLGRLAASGRAGVLASRIVGTGPISPAVAEQMLRIGLDGPEGVPSGTPFDLPADVTRECAIARAAMHQDHDEVLRLAPQLDETPDVMRRRRVRRHVGTALLALDRIGELARFISRCFVEDPTLASMLPVTDCARRLDRDLRRVHAADVSIPILLDIFSKRFDDTLDDVRGYAYEDFLIARGLERPSQLDVRPDDEEAGLLIHYLRNVCVPGIMQVSSAFQGSRELEEERKSVLSLLVKVDPNSAKEYEKELREITRAQLIHRGVRQVERSKIYVDVPSIRRAFDRKHRETFQRYQALARAGIGSDRRELEAAIEDALAGRLLPQELLEVPQNEANDLLLQMLRWLFVECTNSPEHGLDCYLSMRIRHGTLSGQLRSPLEVERIITQRTAEDGEYASNTYWLERLRQLPETVRRAVDDRLATFSADYDRLISRIAGELVQIRSPSRPEGLFVVNLKAVRFRVWHANLTADMLFEDFFEEIMELFWEAVEESLDSVRRTIDDALKPEIGGMFAQLEADVSTLAGDAATADLDRAVRLARTGAMQALDIVKDWFRLSQPISEPPFPIEDLIDVGLQCVTAIHRDFVPVVERDVDPLPPFADALVRFSDIFFIIFDNVRRHSGVEGKPIVHLSIRDEGDRLRIKARNMVADGVRGSDTLARMDAIRQAIDEGDYRQAVSSEGGTGLIKLRKLIGHEEAHPRRLDFGFDGDDFVVELEIGKREIQR